MVFQSVRKYLYDRRRGLAKFAGLVGGAYLAGHYALQRLEETREKILQDRTARENLKRRFQQNQQDCVFTTLALVPGLGNQVLEELDVEGLTLQLQQYGTTPNQSVMQSSFTSDVNRDATSTPPPPQNEASLTQVPPETSQSDTTVDDTDETQTAGESSISTAVPIDSSQSWIREFSEAQADAETVSPSTTYLSLPETALTADDDNTTLTGSVVSATEGEDYSDGTLGESAFTHLRASEATDSFERSSQSSHGSNHFRRSPAPSPSPPPAPLKTKMELWKELKITTFTRTLTILYSLVLLTLTTHVQLNILASHKYVQSVIEMELEEKQREEWGSVLGTSLLGGQLTDMFFGSSGSGGGPSFGVGEDEDSPNGKRWRVMRLSDMTSRKYLTMNWWLLNVGWKNVMEKVQNAVEDVFETVPLKAQMTVDVLRQHLEAVREGVDFESLQSIPGDGELTAEEQDRLQGAPSSAPPPPPVRTDFLPSLLPLTRAAEQHVLVQGGIPPEVIFSYDEESKREEETLRFLLDQTKLLLSSKDFEIVLGKALSWAMEQFVAGMNREVFGGEDDEDGLATEKSLRLAALLPGVTRWSHLAVNALPNELIDGVANLPEVNALSAIIFASYEDCLRNT